jgi:hypothetical protein
MAALTSYIALAVAVSAAAYGAKQQSEAAHAQRKAEKKNAALSRAVAAFQNAKEAKAAVARANIARAQSLALGEGQLGGATSSGVFGAAGSVQSQTAGNIGLSQIVQSGVYGINKVNANLAQDLGKFQSRAQIASSITSIAASIAGGSMGGAGGADGMGNAAPVSASVGRPTRGPAGPGISQGGFGQAYQGFNFNQYAQSFSNYRPG